MNPNQQTIETFYSAFASHDPEGMVSCYHPDAVFRDPVFGLLRGQEIADMWHMLISRSNGNLHIEFYDIEANDQSGSAKWIARYEFRSTGRPVVNNITATFEFRDGLIIR